MVLSTTIESEMKKRKFTPNKVWLNLDKDLNLNQDINVAFWEDPSRPVIFALLEIFNTDVNKQSKTELEKLNKHYFKNATLILLDCDIEGVDFSTVKSTEEAYNHPELPWGIFHEAVIAYIAKLSDEHEVLKNVLRRVGVLSISGTDKNNEEEE
jgi:hypothetical protein